MLPDLNNAPVDSPTLRDPRLRRTDKEIRDDLASPASGKGAAMVAWLSSLPGAVASNVLRLLRALTPSAFGHLTEGQETDVRSYSTASDLTTPLQAAMNAAWGANADLTLPAGSYRTTGLAIPGNSTYRTRAWRLSGQGTGEAFARGYTGGTILSSVTDAPILKYTPDIPNTGGGNLTIDHLRLDGNSTTPVVELTTFYGQSSFSLNSIYQAGTGDGFKSGWSATVLIDRNYALNRDWNGNTAGLGAARTGAGYRIVQSLESGLTTLSKCTARGFRHGYVLGDSLVGMYSPKITDCECSVVYNGILIQPLVRKALIRDNYLEGGDGGTGIEDKGQYSSISGNLIFPGFGIGIDSSVATNYGASIRDNVLSAGSRANTVLLKVASSGVFGGPGKLVSGNVFTFSGSGGTIAGVVGLQITGIDPRIDWNNNIFDPRGPWVGGAGTKKIDNQSTSSDGTAGTGVYGMGIAQDKAGNIEAPHLGRGAINLKVDPTALVDADISSGVLMLGELSVFTVTLTNTANITSFASPNLPDKTFAIHITNNKATLVQGALLKLQGSANYTPGANGSWHLFQIKPGGVAWEASRVAY